MNLNPPFLLAWLRFSLLTSPQVQMRRNVCSRPRAELQRYNHFTALSPLGTVVF